MTNQGLRDFALGELPSVTFIDGAVATSSDPIDESGPLPALNRADGAFLQCTSGSTGLPKGVMLTHENILANLAQIGVGLDVRRDDVVVTWLPLNHDMGIIGCALFALTWGFISSSCRRRASCDGRRRGCGSSPSTAARSRPRRTSRTATSPRACARTRSKGAISSWRVALCGAEPIDVDTLHKFEECFRRFGLRNDVVMPCYGLAEASLAVTFHQHGEPMIDDVLDREPLAMGLVKPAVRDSVRDVMGIHSTNVVSCGAPLRGTEVRVVDDKRNPLPDERVGKILVKGPSVMKGYFELEEKTAETIVDGWPIGDLGYLRDGRLYVTGREKDVVIIRGKCHAPTDFEWPAAEVPGVRKGAVVAFGVFDGQRGTELLHVVCETDVMDDEGRAKLQSDVAAAVARKSGIRPDVVHFVRRDSIPKTTSGKLQRTKTKQAYLEERPSRTWRIF